MATLSGKNVSRNRKHKYQIGQVVQIKASPYVWKGHHSRFGYIVQLKLNYNEPEYILVLQGEPNSKYGFFQKEIKPA